MFCPLFIHKTGRFGDNSDRIGIMHENKGGWAASKGWERGL